MIHLAHPAFLLMGLLILLPLFVRHRRSWQYSSVRLLSARHQADWGTILTLAMTITALSLLVFALARPLRSLAHTHREVIARDIILTLDLSLSMEGHIQTKNDNARTRRKLALIQKAALAFVKRHQDDRLGLIVFGDQAFGAWPLSTDSTTLKRRLERLDELLPAELRGTHVENALVKSLDHMQALGQSETRMIVMLTDGLDTIEPEAQERLVKRIRQKGIKLHVMGIQLPKNASLIRVTREAEGRYYDIDRAEALEQALRDVELHEPSTIHIQHEIEYQEIYPIFVLVGLLLWLGSTVCKTIWVFEV